MTTPYAGFLRRVIAFLIDGVLVLLPPVLLCAPLFIWQETAVSQLAGEEAQAIAVALISFTLYTVWQTTLLITYWLYFALFESSHFQATAGKLLMRIKVVDKNGTRLSFARATGRTFARILSFLMAGAGFVLAACTRKKRALHDFIAETYVVRKDFQAGSELPDTPSRFIWFLPWGIVVAAGFILMLASAPATPDAGLDDSPSDMANAAAARLQTLARTQAAASSLPQDGNRYFRHADGYRVILNDGAQTTLFLPKGSTQICCEDDGENACAQTGFPTCR